MKHFNLFPLGVWYTKKRSTEPRHYKQTPNKHTDLITRIPYLDYNIDYKYTVRQRMKAELQCVFGLENQAYLFIFKEWLSAKV